MERVCKYLALVALLVAPLATIEAANVLCIYTSHSPSHLIIHMSYARALVDRGHNVTVVTSIPINNKELYNHILIPATESRVNEMSKSKTETVQAKSMIESMKASFKTLSTYGTVQAESIKDKRFQDFMHNPDNKFDLVIVGLFLNEFQIGLGEHFKCPVIVSWMSEPNLLVNRLVGNPIEIAYASQSLMFSTADPLTFKGRLLNFAVSASMSIITFFIGRQSNHFYNELFPSPQYPSIDVAKKRISLLFCNSHFSEGNVRPNVPALVEVGGIQVKDKPDPLPKDLQKIFNVSQEHGVIYLSFGSNLGSQQLSPETQKTIFNALSSLKQTILWKYDEPSTYGTAPNIHYRKWLPQDDILAQPNLRLFITHAGKGGVAESQYHGVPMVAIPFFGDQDGNAQSLEQAGFGLRIDRNTMTVDSLKSTILEVMQNPKYRENVSKFSKLYRDRPMTPRETAIYWMEYVIRHKGAYHMESPLRNLNVFQAASLDVFAFLFVVIYLICRAIRFVGGFILRKVFRRSSGEQKEKTS